MEKVIYLIWGDSARPETGAPFDDEVLAAVRRVADLDGVRGASVHVARQAILSARLGRSELPPQSLWCMVSVWLDDALRHAEVTGVLSVLQPDRCHAYSVRESVPRWRPGAAEGARTAGIQLLSLLHRQSAMTHEAFLDHWTERHLPVSLTIHPQWTYVRNDILRALDGGETFDAVCEHGFAAAEHLTDPRYFYGAGNDPELLATNRAVIAKDAAAFVDGQRSGAQTTVEFTVLAAFEPRAEPGFEFVIPTPL